MRVTRSGLCEDQTQVAMLETGQHCLMTREAERHKLQRQQQNSRQQQRSIKQEDEQDPQGNAAGQNAGQSGDSKKPRGPVVTGEGGYNVPDVVEERWRGGLFGHAVPSVAQMEAAKPSWPFRISDVCALFLLAWHGSGKHAPF